jgi:hypothetical protein
MKAFELLENPKSWVQKTYARISPEWLTGVEPTSPQATCWCIVGAIHRCYPENEVAKNRMAVCEAIGWQSPIDWNDAPERTHAEVVALLKKLDI